MDSQSSPPTRLSDRDRIMPLLLDYLRQLTQSRRQQVLAIVAYGLPGRNVDMLRQGLRYEIDRQAERFTAVQWIPLHFPQLRDRLYGNLEYELETQLAPRPGEVMQEVFERVAPLASEANRRVLWLDWGLFHAPPSAKRELTLHELQTWLQFCSDFLTAHCPRGVRIVSYLAIEAEDCDQLGEFLIAQKDETWCKRAGFRFKSLALDSAEQHTGGDKAR
ncbi:MAG: hypothetical protein MJE77_12525 [Proteobacteria bacterium]|nr:hypothetical protein [Pseudomonadota bacterium]